MSIIDLVCYKPTRDSAGMPELWFTEAHGQTLYLSLYLSWTTAQAVVFIAYLFFFFFLLIKANQAPVSSQCCVISLYAQCETTFDYLDFSFCKVSLEGVCDVNNSKTKKCSVSSFSSIFCWLLSIKLKKKRSIFLMKFLSVAVSS